MNRRKRSRETDLLPLMGCLIGIAIVAAGIAIVVPRLAMWSPYFESGSWDRVDAAIESVSLDSHRDRGRASGQVQCTYSYTYQGKTYTRHRVGLESPESSDDFRRLRLRVLQEHMDRKMPVRAWVNPSLPAESLLFRELTEDLYWPPLKGLIFSAVGAVVFLIGLRKILVRKRRERRILQYPDRPWRVDGSRDDFAVRAHNTSTLIACWGVGISLALFYYPVFTDVPKMKDLPFSAWLTLLMPALFALIPVWLLGKAVYLTLQYLKYGNSMLALSQLPIVPGSQFVAVLFVKKHLVTEHGVELTLKCVKTTVTGSGKSQSIDTKDMHNETRIVTRDMARITDRGSAIPIVFDVPVALPDRRTEGNPSYEWTLEVKARTPGIDFSAEFDLPVYRVKDPSLVEKRPAGTIPSVG